MTKAEAFARLGKSKFRSRFSLTAEDLAYVERVGLETIRRHAEDFVRTKLAPAEPAKDGRQTPMRGHPVFKAMHGSAMCCRGCMEKWWRVPRHRPLTSVQERKAVDFLMEWIARQISFRRADARTHDGPAFIVASAVVETGRHDK